MAVCKKVILPFRWAVVGQEIPREHLVGVIVWLCVRHCSRNWSYQSCSLQSISTGKLFLAKRDGCVEAISLPKHDLWDNSTPHRNGEAKLELAKKGSLRERTNENCLQVSQSIEGVSVQVRSQAASRRKARANTTQI